MLGYMPRSAKCATAVINATITSPTSTPSTITLPANQAFNTAIDGVSYTFYNRSAVTVARNNGGNYTFANLNIVEGTPLQFKYTVAAGVRYIIPNANVDLETLTVRVQENANADLFEVYTMAESLTEVSEATKVYFIKEIDDGLYEITFGDGVLGAQLDNGNVITLDYFVSNLEAANTATNFNYGGVALLGSNLSVTTISRATGGASPEDINSIKFNAPRMYAAQNRAVTPDDYAVLITKYFPEADTISVWGGEDNNPPVYGKTFICVKPREANKLTNLQKEFIRNNILNSRNIVSITPEIVDPEFFNIKVSLANNIPI
jgi:hypothetical protein